MKESKAVRRARLALEKNKRRIEATTRGTPSRKDSDYRLKSSPKRAK